MISTTWLFPVCWVCWDGGVRSPPRRGISLRISRVEGLRVVAQEGVTARVVGTATSGPAKVLDARGRAVSTTNATRASLTWVLVRDGAGWRVSEVLRG